MIEKANGSHPARWVRKAQKDKFPIWVEVREENCPVKGWTVGFNFFGRAFAEVKPVQAARWNSKTNSPEFATREEVWKTFEKFAREAEFVPEEEWEGETS